MTLGNGVSFLIFATNLVMRNIIMYVYSKAGCSTHSEEMKYVTMSIFFGQFFNTAIIIMLVNANLREQGTVGKLFNGVDSDFNSRWF